MAWPEGAVRFLARRMAVILRRDLGRRSRLPLPLGDSVTNPVSKTDQQFLKQFSTLIGFLVLVMFSLIGFAMYLYANHPPPVNPVYTQEIQARIAPVGTVYAGDTGRAALLAAQDAAKKAAESQVAYGGTLDGKTIFGDLCTTCHTNAATGAPAITDKAAWAPRVAEGLDTLVKHATEGYTGPDGKLMPAKGGNLSLTDAQVKATVEWMLSQVK